MGNKALDRNPSIDFAKGIAALMVCYQHSCGAGGTGYLLAIARSAVPLFIMITGYLYPDTVERGKQREQIIRFLKISIQIVAVYFLIDLAFKIVSHGVREYLNSLISVNAIKNFVIFNDPIPGDHSWYMWSMVYVLMIALYIPKVYEYKLVRTVFIVTSLVLQVGISKYFFLLTSKEPSALLYRNFLVPVTGYFLLGMSIRLFTIKKFPKGTVKLNCTLENGQHQFRGSPTQRTGRLG